MQELLISDLLAQAKTVLEGLNIKIAEDKRRQRLLADSGRKSVYQINGVSAPAP